MELLILIYSGNTYVASTFFYSSSVKRGDEVIVYINPSDINNTTLRNEILALQLIFYVIGGTLIAGGMVLLTIIIVMNSKNKEFIKTGKKITANIVGEKTNYYSGIFNVRPYSYNLYAEKNGKRYKSCSYIKSVFEKENTGYVVNIYLKDDGNYFLDFTTVRKRNEYTDDVYDQDQYEINFENIKSRNKSLALSKSRNIGRKN